VVNHVAAPIHLSVFQKTAEALAPDGPVMTGVGLPVKMPEVKPQIVPLPTLREKIVGRLNEQGVDPQTTKLDAVLGALEQHRISPGFSSASLPRSAIPAQDLTPEQLKQIGFLPSYVAVPERGQTQIRTWRHPQVGMHLHRHGKEWIFHEDNWPSLSMQVAKFKQDNPNASAMDVLKFQLKSAVTDAAPHVMFEGVPGYINYIAGTMTGEPGFQKRMSGHVAPRARADQVSRGLASSLALGGVYGAATGKAENVAKGTGASLGFLGGNALSNVLERRAQQAGSAFGRPGVSNLAMVSALPALGAAGGFYGGGKLFQSLFGKEQPEKPKPKRKSKSRLTERQLATLLRDPKTRERLNRLQWQERQQGNSLRDSAVAGS